MKPVEITRFIKGYISDLDLETTIAPDGSLRDCLNVEINSPLGAITRPNGVDTVYSLPAYSGSENVAVKRFSVDVPSRKEITALMRVSANLLLYSEDFEITTEWFKDAGLTITANSTNGPTRRGNTLSATSAGDGVEQTLNIQLPISTPVYFSVYYAGGDPNDEWLLKITDGSGTTTYSFNPDGSGQWQRLSVARTLASGSGQKVVLEYNGGTGSKSIDFWGAQLEVGSTETGYGYTFEVEKPYYIYIRPYFNGSIWVDAWRELTEKRACKYDSGSGTDDEFLLPQGGIVATSGEGDDYFKKWYTWSIPTLDYPSFSQVIRGYTQSTDVFYLMTDGTGWSKGEKLIISRAPLGQALLSANYDISELLPYFHDNNGTVSCIFPSDSVVRYPQLIKYISTQDVLGILDYQEFCLEKETRTYSTVSNIWDNIPIQVGATTTTGSIAAADYTIAAVAIFDGTSQLLSHTFTINLASPLGIVINLYYYPQHLTPRLTSIKVYIGTGTVLDEVTSYLIASYDISTGWTASYATQRWIKTFTITSLPSNTPSLFAEMQRKATLETRADYRYKVFVNGRDYVAGMSTKEDSVRYSHIADVVSELGIYPYDSASNYGEIIVISGTAEKIRGLARTRSNDLLIFKDKTTLVYEVQSGRGGLKRLFTAFQGVGCITHRGVAETDFGNFWYDDSNVYLYAGTGEQIQRLGTGRISKYLRSISTYLPYSFAIFLNGINEYWIFTQKSGSLGSTTASDYIILRYSVEFDNWNLAQFTYRCYGVTSTIDNTPEIITITGYYKQYSAGSIAWTPNGYIETHKLTMDGFFEKLLLQAGAEYVLGSDATISLYVNEESSVRSGNSFVMKSGDKTILRQPRPTRFRTLRIKIQFFTGAFLIRAIKIYVALLKMRFGFGRS